MGEIKITEFDIKEIECGVYSNKNRFEGRKNASVMRLA